MTTISATQTVRDSECSAGYTQPVRTFACESKRLEGKAQRLGLVPDSVARWPGGWTATPSSRNATKAIAAPGMGIRFLRSKNAPMN